MYPGSRTQLWIYYLLPVLLVTINLKGQDTITITDQVLTSGIFRWTSNNLYILDGPVILENGVLEIEPGTTILARSGAAGSGNPASLEISKGAQLLAAGTPNEPILFTSEDQKSYWNGITMHGSEGISSGNLTYISIRWAGKSDEAKIGAALTLNQVDESTTIDHVEVFSSQGDGICIWGGNVNLAFVCVSFIKDDAFDWNYGWTGHGLYWLANSVGSNYNRNETSPDPGSFAIEGKSYISNTDTLISNPLIFHATLIGENCGGLSNDTRGALAFLNQSGGTIANSLIVNFANHGIYVEDHASEMDSYAGISTGHLNIQGNIWSNFGRDFGSQAGNTFNSGEGGLILTDSMMEDPSANLLKKHLLQTNFISPFGIARNLQGIDCLALDPRTDSHINDSVIPYIEPPENSFFNEYQPVKGRGAFPSEFWLENWTALDQLDSIIRLGNEALGTFMYKKQILEEKDTLVLSCEALLELHDSLFYTDPCNSTPYQVGAAHRKGNPRRRRPNTRSEESEYAFLETWDYLGIDAIGCSETRALNLTVLVIDTVAPVIHPVPSRTGGLTAITEDCDDSWIYRVFEDTISEGDSTPQVIQFTFFAEDYSGNQSSISVQLKTDEISENWYADLDRDNFGNPLLMISATDSIPGFVRNSEDCNDNNPHAYPGAKVPDEIFGSFDLPVNYSCDSLYANYDICEGALEIPVGSICTVQPAGLINASSTIYPKLPGSCLTGQYADIWLTCRVPESGGIHLRLWEDPFSFLDILGFSRLFMVEFYSGDCQVPVMLHCAFTSGSQLLTDFNHPSLAEEKIYLRIIELGNTRTAPFQICILDLSNKVPNDYCATAIEIDVEKTDSCSSATFTNYNATYNFNNQTGKCHEIEYSADVWFKFTIPEGTDSVKITLDTFDQSALNRPLMTLYKGSCEELSEVSCHSYFSENLPLETYVDADTPGNDFFIRVFDYFGGSGAFKLKVCASSANTVGLNLKDRRPTLQIYPNPLPAKENLQISVNGSLEGDFFLRVYNVNGKLVHEEYVRQYDLNLKLNHINFKPGIYIVQLNNRTISLLTKLVVID